MTGGMTTRKVAPVTSEGRTRRGLALIKVSRSVSKDVREMCKEGTRCVPRLLMLDLTMKGGIEPLEGGMYHLHLSSLVEIRSVLLYDKLPIEDRAQSGILSRFS